MSSESNCIPMPSRIIFDLDNTIYDYESAHRPALDELLKKFSARSGLSLEVAMELWNMSRIEVKNRIGHAGASHNRLIYILELFRISQHRVDLAFALELDAAYWSVYFQEMIVYSNVVDFLQEVDRRRIQKILVTDLTAEIQIKKLLHLGFEGFFDFVITSEEAGGDKITDKPWTLLNRLSSGDHQGSDWYIGDSSYDFNKSYRKPTDSAFMKVDADSALEAMLPGITLFKNYSELIDCLDCK